MYNKLGLSPQWLSVVMNHKKKTKNVFFFIKNIFWKTFFFSPTTFFKIIASRRVLEPCRYGLPALHYIIKKASHIFLITIQIFFFFVLLHKSNKHTHFNERKISNSGIKNKIQKPDCKKKNVKPKWWK